MLFIVFFFFLFAENRIENQKIYEGNVVQRVTPNQDDIEARFVNFASSSNQSLVYGFDEEGNKIAIGIVMDGNFGDGSQIDQEVIEVQQENNDEDTIGWIGAQEECVAVSSDINVMGKEYVKNEEYDGKYQEMIEDYDESKKKEVIKVYKVNRAARKTLKRLKIDLKERKNGLRNKAGAMNKKKRKGPPYGQCMKIANDGKVKPRKRRSKDQKDRTFPKPSGIHGINLKCE